MAAFIGGLICSLVVPEVCRAADPDITVQPVGGLAGLREDFAFNVQAAGTPPLAYQWFFGTKKLANQTNATLLLTNLTAAFSGSYSVSVTNSFGRTNSVSALLTVQSTPSRRLGTGRVVQNGTQVGVPITLRANGREHAVGFSLQYDTNAFANPVFSPANGAATLIVTNPTPGFVGVALALPLGELFPAGVPWVGLLQFDLLGTNGPLNGNLRFATNPIPIGAVNTNGLVLGLSAGVDPQYVIVNSTPALNLQSGLFEQQIIVSNPSGLTNSDVQIFAGNLGRDSRSNAITLYSAAASSINGPLGDPLLNVSCDCACGFRLDGPGGSCDFNTYLQCGSANCAATSGTNADFRFIRISNLQPGESRQLTAELYVSDHFTVPNPLYAVYFTGGHLLVTPPLSSPLAITDTRVTNGLFLVEFPTQLGRKYFVQYATNLATLKTNPQTSSPGVQGTGSRVQWLDIGPPRTETPPGLEPRFYRVLETQ
ncbi:MAG: Matrixin [Verrucomicrobiales bacterium]|nr:Matrixin [Verrucomicrobiales bacterium]